MKIFTGHIAGRGCRAIFPCVKLVHGCRVVSIVPGDLGFSDFPNDLHVAQMDGRKGTIACYEFPTPEDADNPSLLWNTDLLDEYEVEKDSIKTLALAMAWLNP